MTRIVIDFEAGTCAKAWTNRNVRIPSSVSKASTRTGLVYVYEYPAAERSGLPRAASRSPGPRTRGTSPRSTPAPASGSGRVLTGTGLGYNNNYAPITLGPDGTAYVGVLGGILAVRDTR